MSILLSVLAFIIISFTLFAVTKFGLIHGLIWGVLLVGLYVFVANVII